MDVASPATAARSRTLRVERNEAQAERAEAVGVPERYYRLRGDDGAGVGADGAPEGALDHLFPVRPVSLLDEARHHLGVEAGVETDAHAFQLAAKPAGVDEVAVVGDCARAQRRVVAGDRVGVLRAAGASRRVPGVAEG